MAPLATLKAEQADESGGLPAASAVTNVRYPTGMTPLSQALRSATPTVDARTTAAYRARQARAVLGQRQTQQRLGVLHGPVIHPNKNRIGALLHQNAKDSA